MAVIPAALMTAMSAVSAVVGVVGTIQSAVAAKKSGEYNARVAERDMIVTDQNRKMALTQARVASEDKRRENLRVMSSIRSQYGNSGLDMAGSPLDVLQDSAMEMELDVQRTQFEGRTANRSAAMQMLGLNENAYLSRKEGEGAYRAGVLGAAGQSITGGVKVYDRLTRTN